MFITNLKLPEFKEGFGKDPQVFEQAWADPVAIYNFPLFWGRLVKKTGQVQNWK